ncbi:ABC transporter family substrate-binding protein [Streptomyces sp. 35G-GA-8]|uniref:ABC transporter family substrate-binding protein n=1 Tax=Streptomyces sp. 35G-GA-8 TaxID=2939434 RepID=UPI00201FA573|nr:ABC transporter family substrate-binding protein [Streptomyces sp. 35G-GA-8]MCL7375913.1 ABC transporter family substrate-binding protein [Streptomyces sp. 35G-GA-8]
MSHVGAPRGRTCSRTLRSRTLRSVALLTTGVLALGALSACSSEEEGSEPSAAAAPDIAAVKRDGVAQGGTMRWAVDTMPATLNSYQADADAATSRIAGAVLPALFTLDKSGRPQRNPDYLESAKIVEREPKQVVLYKLNQQAVWSNGREIGAPDFVAQWRALRGKDSAYWTARNAGYERIEKIERGANNLEVRVTFNKPYADWESLFSPLYPKDVMGTPNAFNDGARKTLKVTAGPFTVKKVDRKAKETTLARNPHWWGEPAKLDQLVMRTVPRGESAAALAARKVDIVEIDSGVVKRMALAEKDAEKAAEKDGEAGGGQPLTHGPGIAITPGSALRSWALANGSDEEAAEEAMEARKRKAESIARYAREQKGLTGWEVRKSLEPAFTQLALNGESGPLADERVRRAVARAINRQELADTVLKPLGLPAKPPGSHLALMGQKAYSDASEALGKQDTLEAQALLADAGWTPDGAKKKVASAKAGSKAQKKRTEEGDEELTEEEAEAAAEAAAQAKRPDAKTEEAEKKKAEEQKRKYEEKVAAEEKKKGDKGDDKDDNKDAAKKKSDEGDDKYAADVPSDEGLYIVGDEKPGKAAPRPASAPATQVLAPASVARVQGAVLLRQAAAVDDSDSDKKPGGVAGAYAPRGTAAASASPSPSSSVPTVPSGPLGKDGKPLSLRFVLPAGAGAESLRAVGERISRMLDRIGVGTEITKVADEEYFKDHIASGHYDLALYSWPASAFPATDGRPIYAKPVPASDGSLLVEQNYTRVGTDHIDQLFASAAAELNEGKSRDLVRQADARIWAAAGSIPLYQRPQLVAVRPTVVNAGAFGFQTPRYQDVGFREGGAAGPDAKKKK